MFVLFSERIGASCLRIDAGAKPSRFSRIVDLSRRPSEIALRLVSQLDSERFAAVEPAEQDADVVPSLFFQVFEALDRLRADMPTQHTVEIVDPDFFLPILPFLCSRRVD